MQRELRNHGYEHRSRAEATLYTSMRERYCFEQFVSLLNTKAGYRKFEYNESPAYGNCVYDAILKVYDKENKMTDYAIVEIKVREELHGSYFMEKKKKDALYKEKENVDLQLKMNGHNLESIILYVNFTQAGVYVWDILELEEKGRLKRGTRKEMNAITIVSKTKKQLKSVYELQVFEGIRFTNFIFKNSTFLDWYEGIKNPNKYKNTKYEIKKSIIKDMFTGEDIIIEQQWIK